MDLPDYYAVLGIFPEATQEQIKHSYRTLVRTYHPDINKSAGDTRIKQINEAYAVLSDASRRTVYDIARLEQKKHDVMIDVLINQRELARQQRLQRRKRMTWKEGAVGFVRELKKEMRRQD
ncbi:MAG TPA: DnaJ domain-containing protein [Dictyobacter sp.]|jgi:curved DNA-binding protein CbpA|nr:DnaJ domain-containing protein [Dictyobacter sp.]